MCLLKKKKETPYILQRQHFVISSSVAYTVFSTLTVLLIFLKPVRKPEQNVFSQGKTSPLCGSL